MVMNACRSMLPTFRLRLIVARAPSDVHRPLADDFVRVKPAGEVNVLDQLVTTTAVTIGVPHLLQRLSGQRPKPEVEF